MSAGVYSAALALAAKGIPVFPCVANAKNPLTARGLHDASTDPDVVNAWAQRWPQANLAIPTGNRSGLVAIDIDRKGGVDGLATLTAIEIDLGQLPTTLTAATPSGGEHRFFVVPSTEIRNSAGKLAGYNAPGFDVRGEGGYVLVAPSSIDGRAYSWHAPRVQPVELPTRWVMALTPRSAPKVVPITPWVPPSCPREQSRVDAWCLRALQHEARELRDAPLGTRNDRLWRAAAALGGLVHTRGIDPDDVRRALKWACSTWAVRSPQKDESTLESGLAFGIANPRDVEIGVADAV